MAYINTIQLEPQESAQALAEAMAQALGKALKWTVEGTAVWAPGSGVAVQFRVSSSSVATGIKNTITSADGSAALSWAAGRYYCVDYVQTGSTLAAGIRLADSPILLDTIIAMNTVGEYKGIALYSNNLRQLAEGYTAAKSSNGFTVSAAGASTSIVRFPDMWGGCMFTDLYFVMSCPAASQTDLVFYIGGKYYRRIGAAVSLALAVPVE